MIEFHVPKTEAQREYVNVVNKLTIPLKLSLVAGVSLKRGHLRIIETAITIRNGDGTVLGELRSCVGGTWQIMDKQRQETWDIDMRAAWEAFHAAVAELPTWLDSPPGDDAP